MGLTSLSENPYEAGLSDNSHSKAQCYSQHSVKFENVLVL